jgi:hypothetical protein
MAEAHEPIAAVESLANPGFGAVTRADLVDRLDDLRGRSAV